MMNKIASNLLDLTTFFPTYRIIPVVDTDVVAGDEFIWWVGSLSSCEIGKVLQRGESLFIYTQSYDDLVDEQADEIEGLNPELPYPVVYEQARQIVDDYNWENVILLYIGLPEEGYNGKERN